MSRKYLGLVEWRLNGEHGISSCAIADRLEYGRVGRNSSHPRDPSDLNRCVKMLRATVGMREDLHLMADVSPEWAALVDHWAELTDLLDTEMSSIRSAPKTYTRMRELIESAAHRKEAE